MKSVKIAVAALIVVSALVYAAKTPQVFCEGLEGFTKPEVTPVVTTEEGVTYVDFGETLGAKGSVQFTTCNAENVVVMVGQVKSISQKGGKVVGTLNAVSTSDPDLQLKLKGIAVGTVIAGGLKSAQVASLENCTAGFFAKGTAVKAVNAVGPGEYAGTFKSISAGWFEDIDGSGIATPKSLSLKAKTNLGGVVTLPGGTVYKAKNVTVVTAE